MNDKVQHKAQVKCTVITGSLQTIKHKRQNYTLSQTKLDNQLVMLTS